MGIVAPEDIQFHPRNPFRKTRINQDGTIDFPEALEDSSTGCANLVSSETYVKFKSGTYHIIKWSLGENDGPSTSFFDVIDLEKQSLQGDNLTEDQFSDWVLKEQIPVI
jgi:hypothetical protein